MFDGLMAQRLAALFVAALLLLNFPLLSLWDHDVRVGGLPLFPLALFGIWAVMIAAVAWIVESDAGDTRDGAAAGVHRREP